MSLIPEPAWPDGSDDRKAAPEGDEPQGVPLTGYACGCRPGVERDNCGACEGSGRAIDWAEFHRQLPGYRYGVRE